MFGLKVRYQSLNAWQTIVTSVSVGARSRPQNLMAGTPMEFMKESSARWGYPASTRAA